MPTAFQNWDVFHPNKWKDQSNSCVEVKTKYLGQTESTYGVWTDKDCDSKSLFLCEQIEKGIFQ